MRFVSVTFVGILLCGALAFSNGTRATAQMPPLTAPPVPALLTPDAAIEGVVTSASRRTAVLQTPDGQSVRLALTPGYLLVDPSPQALSTGMRVFAQGVARADGTVDVAEIDVLVPQNLLLVTPAPAQTAMPSPSPAPSPAPSPSPS